jgi:hypothetical protein
LVGRKCIRRFEIQLFDFDLILNVSGFYHRILYTNTKMARVSIASKPRDLYDNLASSLKAASSRDVAISKASRATLNPNASLVSRLINAATLKAIAPVYQQGLIDQISGQDKLYTRQMAGSYLEEGTGHRLKEARRTQIGTSTVRPGFMGEQALGGSMASEGEVSFMGGLEPGTGGVAAESRDLSFANPVEPYEWSVNPENVFAAEALGAKVGQSAAANATATTTVGSGGAVSRSLYNGAAVQAEQYESQFQRDARIADLLALQNARFEAENPMNSSSSLGIPIGFGGHEGPVVYGEGSGSLIEGYEMGGRGSLRQLDEIREAEGEEEGGGFSLFEPGERESGIYRPAGKYGGEQLGSSLNKITPASGSSTGRSQASTVRGGESPAQAVEMKERNILSFGTFAEKLLKKQRSKSLAQGLAQQERRRREAGVSLTLTSMVGQLSEDPELAEAVRMSRGYSFKGAAQGKVSISKKPKVGAKL